MLITQATTTVECSVKDRFMRDDATIHTGNVESEYIEPQKKALHELRADSIIKVKVGRAAWVYLIFVECRSSKKSSAVTIQVKFCTRLDKAMNMNFPRAQQESKEMDDRSCVEVDWTLLDVLRLITNEQDVAMPLFSLNLFTCNCFDSLWIHPKSRELSF